MDPMCPSIIVIQTQHLVSFIIGFVGEVLDTVATGVSQILDDLGSWLVVMANNCTAMTKLTTGIFGDNGGLVYWINEKILWFMGELF